MDRQRRLTLVLIGYTQNGDPAPVLYEWDTDRYRLLRLRYLSDEVNIRMTTTTMKWNIEEKKTKLERNTVCMITFFDHI